MNHQAKSRKYFYELLGSMALYVVAVQAAIRLAPSVRRPELQLLLAICPMLPIGLAIWAMARHFRRLDEYLRQVTLENIAIAAAVTAGASLTYGFLENAGFPRLSMFAVWPLMGGTWGAVACLRGYLGR